MATMNFPPRHRAKKIRWTSVSRGLDSLNLDPSPRLRALRREIEKSNTVAEAWSQTGELLTAAMSQSPASTRNSSR